MAGQGISGALPFQHGHLALLQDGLDFVNTLEFSRQGASDELDSAERALDWLCRHDLLHHEAREAELLRCQASPQASLRLLGRLRRVRTAMRELLEAAAQRRPPALAELAEINRVLRAHYVYELAPSPDGVSMEHRHQGDPIDGALARLAESLARELIQGHPERLRLCQNSDCRWVFADTSRTGRRKWCDMSTCGNRAKVARHRARKQAVDVRR